MRNIHMVSKVKGDYSMEKVMLWFNVVSDIMWAITKIKFIHCRLLGCNARYIVPY